MFARKVAIRLKPNSIIDLTQRLEAEAFRISLWDTAENAEACNRPTFAGVAKILSRVVEGDPQPIRLPIPPSTRLLLP